MKKSFIEDIEFLLRVWAWPLILYIHLLWVWHTGTYMPNLMLLAFILAKIDAFIQTDRWKVPKGLNFRAIPRRLVPVISNCTKLVWYRS